MASPHLRKMHLQIVRRGFVASNRQFNFAVFLAIIGGVALTWEVDNVVAFILAVTMRRSQRFALMDVPTFLNERYQYELPIVFTISPPLTVGIFILVYVFSSALCILPNTAFMSLIRVTDATSYPSRVLRNNSPKSKSSPSRILRNNV